MQLNERSEQLSELREGVEHELQALAQPLRERLTKIDALMTERLDDLKALREVRRQVVTALRPFVGDDEALPPMPGAVGPKPGTKRNYSRGKRDAHTRVAEQRITDALDWIRDNVNGRPFTSRELREGLGFSRSSSEAVVRVLREREQIRVVTQHRGPSYPATYAAVTS